MKTQTLKNINSKSPFINVARAAVDLARREHSLVRFEMGPAKRRQTFVASPKKPLATLVWEWARTTKPKAKRAPAEQIAGRAADRRKTGTGLGKMNLSMMLAAAALIGQP